MVTGEIVAWQVTAELEKVVSASYSEPYLRACRRAFMVLQQRDKWIEKTGDKWSVTGDHFELKMIKDTHLVHVVNFVLNKEPEAWARRHFIGSLPYRSGEFEGPDELEETLGDFEWSLTNPRTYLEATPLMEVLQGCIALSKEMSEYYKLVQTGNAPKGSIHV